MTQPQNRTTFLAVSCALALAFALISLNCPASKSTVGKETPQLLDVGGSHFYISVSEGDLNVSRDNLINYVRDAARAVIAYYGSFPVRTAVVSFIPSDDEGVGYGSSTYNDSKGLGEITINIGENATTKDLKQSWTLTHEMMHLGFPVVGHSERWLAEGIATYVEPIGRMRIGNITREEVWADLLKNLPKGLPRQGDGGLQSAHNYQRIYWGGALYCLLADVQIRERTGNHLGLEDALRSIAKQGGTAASDWNAQVAVEAGDKGIGVTVMQELYTKMKDQPVSIDVVDYMRRLGVIRTADSVRFDEHAPLSSIRRAIDGLN